MQVLLERAQKKMAQLVECTIRERSIAVMSPIENEETNHRTWKRPESSEKWNLKACDKTSKKLPPLNQTDPQL